MYNKEKGYERGLNMQCQYNEQITSKHKCRRCRQMRVVWSTEYVQLRGANMWCFAQVWLYHLTRAIRHISVMTSVDTGLFGGLSGNELDESVHTVRLTSVASSTGGASIGGWHTELSHGGSVRSSDSASAVPLLESERSPAFIPLVTRGFA